jgi:hypothetical protein
VGWRKLFNGKSKIKFERMNIMNSKRLVIVLLALIICVASLSTSAFAAYAPSFVMEDKTSKGDWVDVYGKDGFWLVGMDQNTLPSYAKVTVTGAMDYTYDKNAYPYNEGEYDWTTRPSLPDKSDRIHAVKYSDVKDPMSVEVSTGDKEALVTFYILDSDNVRNQSVKLVDGDGNLVESTELKEFGNGIYLQYKVKGTVTFGFVPLNGVNAIFNAIFFDPASSGSSDTTTDTTTTDTATDTSTDAATDTATDTATENPETGDVGVVATIATAMVSLAGISVLKRRNSK